MSLQIKVEKYYKLAKDGTRSQESRSYKISGKEGTISLRKELLVNGAKYYKFLHGGPGWIVGVTKYEKFKEWLMSLSKDKYTLDFIYDRVVEKEVEKEVE